MLELRQGGVTLADGRRILSGASLAVAPGERVCVLGPNGSGKSTLLSVLGMVAERFEGELTVDGVVYADATAGELRRQVGIVFQDPADQIVTTVVADEVAFAPRNLGLAEDEVARRVDAALAAVGLADAGARGTGTLSGGEQQRVALTAVLAMEPAYLLLDEVSSMVDAAERARIRALVRALAAERGAGIVQVTHDPLEALSADRVVVLEGGRVAWEGEPRALAALDEGALGAWLRMGPYARALQEAMRAGLDASRGVEPEDLAAWLQGAPDGASKRVLRWLDAADEPDGGLHFGDGEGGRGDVDGVVAMRADGAPERRSLAAKGLAVSRGGASVLEDVDVDVPSGAVTLITGPSGAGKTTLALALAGLLDVDAGAVRLGVDAPEPGEVALAFQRPDGQFFLETVRDEIAFAPRSRGLCGTELDEAVGRATRVAGVACDLLDRDPFSLSGGQARRVEVAAAISAGTDALILDEPSAGLDAKGALELERLARSLADAGMAVVVISHDVEEWLGVADRAVILAAGRVAWQGEARDLARDAGVFTRSGLAAPASLRLRELVRAAAGPSSGTAAAAGSASRSRRSEPTASAEEPPLARVDARVKLVLLLATVICAFLPGGPVTLAAWVAVLVGATLLSGEGPAGLVRALRPAAIVIAVVVAVNLVAIDGSADIAVAPGVGLSLAGGARAARAVVRIAVLLGLSLAVARSTTPTDLADGFVRLLAPLGRLGAPIDELGLVLSLALRFLPLVGEEVDRVRMAQRSRGARFDDGPVRERVATWASVLVPVVVGLFRRADALSVSMDARCYALGARVSAPPRPLGPGDLAALACGLAVLALVGACSMLGW